MNIYSLSVDNIVPEKIDLIADYARLLMSNCGCDYGFVFKFGFNELATTIQPLRFYLTIKNHIQNKKVLDLCCGTGFQGILLSQQNNRITFSDHIEQAKLSTLINCKINNVESFTYIDSDIFSNINDTYDVIVSNPPCISEKEFVDLDIENLIAISSKENVTAGEDGMYYLKTIIQEAPKYLNSHGQLFLPVRNIDHENALINYLNSNTEFDYTIELSVEDQIDQKPSTPTTRIFPRGILILRKKS